MKRITQWLKERRQYQYQIRIIDDLNRLDLSALKDMAEYAEALYAANKRREAPADGR